MGRHSSHLIVDAAPNVDESTLRLDEGQFPGRPAQRIEFDITDEQACFSRLGDVALHGVRRAGLQPDESVAVFGQGVVGQLIVGVCRIAGAHPIVAVDLDPERLKLSMESGATHVVDASSTDAVEEVTRITGGAECVFHANRVAQTLDDCVRSAGYAGKVVLVGATGGEARLRLGPILSREIDIRGSQWSVDSPHKYYPWSSPRDRAAIMRMIESGRPEDRPPDQPRREARRGRRPVPTHRRRHPGLDGHTLRLGRLVGRERTVVLSNAKDLGRGRLNLDNVSTPPLPQAPHSVRGDNRQAVPPFSATCWSPTRGGTRTTRGERAGGLRGLDDARDELALDLSRAYDVALHGLE